MYLFFVFFQDRNIIRPLTTKHGKTGHEEPLYRLAETKCVTYSGPRVQECGLLGRRGQPAGALGKNPFGVHVSGMLYK